VRRFSREVIGEPLASADMSAPNPYNVQPSAPPMQQTYPSVNQAPPMYPSAPPPPAAMQSAAPTTTAKSTTEDFKAVAKGVAGVARLMGKGAAALGTAPASASAASTSTTSHQSQPASPHYGRGAAPYAQVMRPAPQPVFHTAPVPHSIPHSVGIAYTPGNTSSTCWCGCRDDPETDPCFRALAKTVLFPLAIAAYPLGAALWAALQAHFCVFSCCMVHRVHAATQTAAAKAVGAPTYNHERRDVVDCWQFQAEAWVWLDNKNGNCWVCELPVSKRALRGHVVEAPCQLCLWGSER